MDIFNHVLNWKLKVGSHQFPGPDGGTCINEAALVAAGFEYKPIRTPDQMPECFSRPICRLAMRLNDIANDEERQRLLPYVTRLACADTRSVEQVREVYIGRCLGYLYQYLDDINVYLSRVEALPFDRGLEALEGALAIGRQADPLGPEIVQSRMDAARVRPWSRTQAPTSVPTSSLATKVKDCLTMKETEPTV